MRAYLCAFAALAMSPPSTAAWYRASSEHFVIYSDQGPDRLKQFAANLEKFDGAVRSVRGMADLPLSQGNRLTVYRLDTSDAVQRLIGDDSGSVLGFYNGRASGSVAFVGPGEQSNEHPVFAPGSHIIHTAPNTSVGENIILLHEYAHHLMMQDLRVPYPQWLVEGFAEFMSTAQFESDGTVRLGLPAAHRYEGLVAGDRLPIEKMLSGDYDRITGEQFESIYGRGWLLTHYLTFEPSRQGQLAAYLMALAKGVPALDAAKQAFGDLGQLDRDLEAYLHRGTLHFVKVPASALAFAPIQVTELSAGGSAVMPLLIELKNGVPAHAAEALAAKVRGVEARYPGDELVETTLAEAELDAKHADAAEKAADRALAANARDTDAIVLKGKAIAARATSAQGPERAALFSQARKIFISANAIDKEDPEPLMEFYKAYAEEGVAPTANATAALHYASDLAPQDLGLRMDSALAYVREGDAAQARRALVPIAYNPHGRKLAKAAKQMMGEIDAGDMKAAQTSGEAAEQQLEQQQ
jgi:tetratricopeptide (TPR) repeat protein